MRVAATLALFAALAVVCLALPGRVLAEPASPPPVPPPATTPRIATTVNQVEDSRFPLVVAYVTAMDDSGSPLAGLTSSNFSLTEDGVAVSAFDAVASVNAREPLAVAVVMDISGSMEGKSLDYARQAASSFLDVIGPRDVVELISFSTSVKVNVPLTTTKSIVAVGIGNLRAGGDTALYDAVTVAVQSLAQLPAGRKVVVLLTDGEDTKSKIRPEEALAIAGAKRVPVFAVGLGAQVDKGALDAIAAKTGGRVVYAPSPPDLAKAYRSLADQLRGQYAISFGSGLRADGKEHKLSVKATYAGASAEGQALMLARQTPPWVDITAPRTRQVITREVSIEVGAEPNVPKASIRHVGIYVDDHQIDDLSSRPYTAMLKPDSLAEGPHVLKVAAFDSAGNSASHEIDFTVSRPAKPTPQPTATPEPVVVAEPEPPPDPGLPAVALLGLPAVLGIGWTALGRRARRRRVRAAATCLRCGTRYNRQEFCPTCAVEHRRHLLRRLREVLSREDPAGEVVIPTSEASEEKSSP